MNSQFEAGTAGIYPLEALRKKKEEKTQQAKSVHNICGILICISLLPQVGHLKFKDSTG